MKRIGVIAVLTVLLLTAAACSSQTVSQAPQDDMISETPALDNTQEAPAEEPAEAAPEVPEAQEEETAAPAEEAPSDDDTQLIAAEEVEQVALPDDVAAFEPESSDEETPVPEVTGELDEGDNTIAGEGNTATATQPVFIRDYPSSEEGEVIGGVPLGGVVTVLSADQWGWYYIEYEGITGYAYGEYFN